MGKVVLKDFPLFGHIVCVAGYDDRYGTVRIHDPYGEWFPNGYQIDRMGSSYNMTYRTFTQLCDDGGIWTHFFSR